MELLRSIKTLLLFLTCLHLTSAARPEPAQYCKYRSSAHAIDEVDFCMGTFMYQNATTNSHDLFLTFTFRRPQGSAKGWTSIGTGSIMSGSLMFIVYGDPLSGEQPIVSIRKSTGHHQPTLVTPADLPYGMDLRVVDAQWTRGDTLEQSSKVSNPSMSLARVSIICYSCALWPTTDLSPTSKSQPWIWAWNPKQEFEMYSYDIELDMHKHHAGQGGWGNFYIDMASTISKAPYPPSLPPVRPGVEKLHTSEQPMGFMNTFKQLGSGSAFMLHGLALGIAFVLLFPMGVVGLRIGKPKSFQYHWVIQLIGSILIVGGILLGYFKSEKIDTWHQWIGIGIALVLGFQGFFGWWHHVRYVRLKRRTWVSHVHIWLGRAVMAAGWYNVISGLVLSGYAMTSMTVISMTVFVVAQAVGLSLWLYMPKLRRRQVVKYTAQPTWADAGDNVFRVSASDDEEDGEDGAKDGLMAQGEKENEKEQNEC